MGRLRRLIFCLLALLAVASAGASQVVAATDLKASEAVATAACDCDACDAPCAVEGCAVYCFQACVSGGSWTTPGTASLSPFALTAMRPSFGNMSYAEQSWPPPLQPPTPSSNG